MMLLLLTVQSREMQVTGLAGVHLPFAGRGLESKRGTKE